MSASPSPGPDENSVPAHHAQGTQTIMAEVFGDGSDLSDSDSDGEPAVPKRKAFPPRGDAPVADDEDEMHQPAASDDDDDDDEEGGDGAYVPGTINSAAKIPKFKKRVAGDEDGEEDDGEERVKERKKKKSKRKGEKRRRDSAGDRQDDEEDAPMVDEATQKRLALEARIDNIGKKAKTNRKRKGEDVVDSYFDDIGERLRDRMMNAVDKDRQSNENHMPATAKLAMLDEVMSVLRNSALWTSVVDNGVLEAVRAWLEPMEATAALPAVGIQSALFEVLPKMDLDTATLKESRLGPIVLFYTKTKRVTPAISRAADALVQSWTRPIVKRPGDSRRHADEGEGSTNRADSQSQSQSQSQGGAGGASSQGRRRFDAANAIKENHGRKGARMPQVKETQYTVTPVARLVHHEEDTAQVRKIANDNKKFNKFARQMRTNKR